MRDDFNLFKLLPIITNNDFSIFPVKHDIIFVFSNNISSFKSIIKCDIEPIFDLNTVE